MGTQRNKKHKKKYKRRNTGRLIIVFAVTLTAIVGLGVAAIFLLDWIGQDNAGIPDTSETDEVELGHIAISKEAIPEDSDEEETAAAVEEAVEEIKETNSRYAEQIADEQYLEDNNIYVKEGNDENADEMTVTFAGDVLFDSNYAVMSTLKQNGGDIASGIDENLLSIMRNSDVMMVNNEFPYSTGGTPTEGKTYTFRADPSTASYLNDMGVDVVSLANNHAYDYGEQAFLDTMDTLDGAGVAYVGGGHNIDEASRPVYYIVNNIKIGILAATQIERQDNPDTKGATDTAPGVFRCWNNDRLLAKITEVKQNCDFLIVYIHWGTESTTEIDWAQQEQGPEMAEAGADLIIGDHPHVLQPISAVNGVPVIYSLGNFWFNSKEADTCMIQAVIGENGLKSLRFIPALQSGCRTKLLTGDSAAAVIGEVQAMSPNVSIDSDGYITY